MSTDFLDGCFLLLEHAILTDEQQALQIQSFLHNQVPLLTTEQITSFFPSLLLSPFLFQYLFAHLLPFSHNNHFLVAALLLTKSSRFLECEDSSLKVSTVVESNETGASFLWRIPPPDPISSVLQRTVDAMDKDALTCTSSLLSFYRVLVEQEYDSPLFHTAITTTLRHASDEEQIAFVKTMIEWTQTHTTDAAVHALHTAVIHFPALWDVALYIDLLTLLHRDDFVARKEQPDMLDAALSAVFLLNRLPDKIECFFQELVKAHPNDKEVSEVLTAWASYATRRDEKDLPDAGRVEEECCVKNRFWCTSCWLILRSICTPWFTPSTETLPSSKT